MYDAPKLMRRSTIVAGISYTFPTEDAYGFPEVLPHARKIGLGRRSLTGFLTSGRKVDGLGPFESSLERDYYVLLEFDRHVLAWHPQPVRIEVPRGNGKRARRYTPDVAVEYATQPDGQELDRTELCEIKYRQELKSNWDDIKPLLKAGFRYAREHGWKFRVVTELEIRTPLLWNAKFFLPYGERGTHDEDIARLVLDLKRMGPCTPATLLENDRVNILEHGRLLSTLWHMVAKGIVLLDFSKQANMHSRIWLNDQAKF